MGALGKAAGIAFTAAMGAATAGVGVGLKVAADLEQATIGFETMLGSAKAADSFLRDLQQFAAKTPFDFPTLQKAASRLVAVGTEADRVIPIMTVLGDATAAMGTGAEGVDRAVMALQQMQVKGKVTGEEMLQLAEAGVPAWEALASQLGVTTAQAQEMVSQGKVSVEDLFTAIETRQGESFSRMNGMMDKQSTTLTGLWSTAVDTVQMKLAAMMTPLIPAIKSAMESALPIVENGLATVQEKFQVLVEQVPNLLGAIAGRDAQGIAEVLDNILGNTGEHVDTIRAAVEQLLPVWDSFKASAQNLLDVARDLGPLLGVALGGGLRLAWEALQLLAPVLEDVTGFLSENEWAVYTLIGAYAALKATMSAHSAAMAVQAAGGMAKWIKQTKIASAVTKAWTAVQWLFNAAMRANPIVLVVSLLATLVGALVTAYNTSDSFRETVNNAFSKVAEVGRWMWENVLRPVFSAIQEYWSAVMTAIVWAWNNLVKPAWNALAATAEWLWNSVLAPAFAAIGAAWDALMAAMKWVWENILKPAWDALVAAAQWVWDKVSGIFSSMSDGVSRIFTTIRDTVSRVWNGLRDTVVDTAQDIWDWVVDRFNGLKDAATGIFRGIRDTIADIWNGIQEAVKAPIRLVFNFVNDKMIGPVNSILDKFPGNLQIPTLPRLASGGLVRGPGTETSDSILGIDPSTRVPTAAVSRNEFVVNARATRRHRRLLEAINSGTLRAYASGGLVGREWGAPSLSDFEGTSASAEVTSTWDRIKGFAAEMAKAGARKAAEWVLGPIVRAAKDLIPDKVPLSMLEGGIDRLYNAILGKGDEKDAELSANAIGPNLAIPPGPGGHPGNGYQALFATVKRHFPEARLNSGYRPGDPGYHGRGLAVDLGWMRAPGGIGNAYMAAMNQWIYDNFPNSRELIYNGLGDNRPNLKNGRNFPYNAATQAQHRNHVHWVYDEGGVLRPGLSMVHNKSGKPEAVFNHEQWRTFEEIAAGRGNAPLIGQLVIQPSAGETTAQQLEEVNFQIRRIKRGARIR